jgi:two-component system chemotaxis response regulator CheB
VDDSPLALAVLKRMLATSPDIEIVGTARNGKEALAMFAAARPKVICTDYQMPVMDGLELIQQVMAVYPRPILVISSLVTPNDHQQALPLLAAGAVDVFPKPSASNDFDSTAKSLVRKIKMLAGVFVISRRAPEGKVAAPGETQPLTYRAAGPLLPPARAGLPLTAAPPPAPVTPPVHVPSQVQPNFKKGVRIVAIGSSTGGPQVLQALLSKLPADFPCPIVCVQHISAGFLVGLVDWLHGQSRVRIKIAEPNEMAMPGTVYFPPENTHLEVNSRGYFVLSNEPAVDGHKPSVTCTFQSVAKHYGSSALGILLTGMGSDGASGMQTLFQSGAMTIAQAESSCVVFGMPRQAIELGAAQYVLSTEEISEALLRLAATK